MSRIVTDKKGRPIAATVSIFSAVLTLGYMLPWMIAALRGKSNHWGIFVVNLLLGWTIIGWVIALVQAAGSHHVAGFGPSINILNQNGFVPQAQMQFPPAPPGYPQQPLAPAQYPAQPILGQPQHPQAQHPQVEGQQPPRAN